MSSQHISPDQIVQQPSGNGLVGVRRRQIGAFVASRFSVPGWVMLMELFGLGWGRAADEKTINPMWWNGTVLSEFINTHVSQILLWYRAFNDRIVEPNTVMISVVVVVAQLVAGVTLVTGRRVVAGLLIGMFFNRNFVAAGAVNPSIFYLICEAALLLCAIQNRAERGVAGSSARWIPVASLVLLIVNLPFVSTIEPSAVTEDPALILVFFGFLMAVSSRLGSPNASTDSRLSTGRDS